jgi:pimeloyl-ACP methyl ester carboxylesterase
VLSQLTPPSDLRWCQPGRRAKARPDLPADRTVSTSCTIVLVHGAFAESASWDGVIDPLVAEGHRMVAAATPLRGLAVDAAAVSDPVRSVEGPVVLVAHSYGGTVITNVDPDAGDIAGRVYVNGFAPEPGENCFQLAGMFPGSMLGEETARPVSRSDGMTDQARAATGRTWGEIRHLVLPAACGRAPQVGRDGHPGK